MKNLFILTIIVSHIFSYEIYKEIKIENVNDQLVSNLQLLNIDIDHVHMNDDNSIKFETRRNKTTPSNFFKRRA